MIGQTVLYNRILDKLGEGGIFENHLPAFYASGCDFQNPRLTLFDLQGGQQAPSFLTAVLVAVWRRHR